MIARVFLLASLLFAGAAHAATVTADSCSVAHVQAAIDAAVDGDTVQIPTGTCTWASQVTFNASTRALHLKGNGQGSTVITVNASPVLAITGGSGKQWKLSDLKLIHNAAADTQNAVTISGSTTNFRVYNLTIESTNGWPAYTFTIGHMSSTYGLFDHLTVTGNVISLINAMSGDFTKWTDSTYGNWGDEKAIFLEDSSISFNTLNQGRYVIDCEAGGRYVIRYNTITNARMGSHGFDTGGYSSCLSAEIYNNTISYTSTWDVIESVLHHRGGTILMHNNTISYSTGTWVGTGNAQFKNYRADGGASSWPTCSASNSTLKWASSLNTDWSGTPALANSGNKWMMCSNNRMRLCEVDGDCTGGGTCSLYADGTGSGGYPCFQQIGRGINNALVPAYEWDNTWSGGQGGSGCGSPPCDMDFAGATYVEVNRDYYNDTQAPGYTAYTYPHPLQGSKLPGPSNPRWRPADWWWMSFPQMIKASLH